MTSASRAQPSLLRLLLLLPLLPAGVFSILGSSLLEDDDDDNNDEPVVVDFVLGSLASPLDVDIGERFLTFTNLRVAGFYDGTAGNDLTINRDDDIVDATTGFDLAITAGDPDDDPFGGDVTLDVTAEMDLVPDLGENPTMGRFSTLAEGTTTIVTVRSDGDGVDVAVGAADPVAYSWNDFEDLASDEDEDPDLRFASSAYNALRTTLVLALVIEAGLDNIDDNADTLEDIGLDEALELDCDTPLLGGTAGERALFWRLDQTGAGQGDVGEGDGFEERFSNCYDRDNDRYVEGTLLIGDYVPQEGPTPRSLAGNATFGLLFVSETEISITTPPSRSSPRVNGEMSLRYDEVQVIVEST